MWTVRHIRPSHSPSLRRLEMSEVVSELCAQGRQRSRDCHTVGMHGRVALASMPSCKTDSRPAGQVSPDAPVPMCCFMLGV